MYIPIFTPIILALTTRPNVYDVVNETFHATVGDGVQNITQVTGANEDRRGLAYIDPRIDRDKYFASRNKEK